MGLFGKIKNILFEDDDEVGDMPVYTKEDVKEVPKEKEEQKVQVPFDSTPIEATNDTHFNNVKRDIDLQFDDNDVIGEVKGAKEALEVAKENEAENSSYLELPKEEKKSPFLPFDEDEFERLNSRINSNESKIKHDTPKEINRENRSELPAMKEARRANNNFSSTTTTTEKNENDPDRYKINPLTGRKPFKPSPVISPVYGILDKNYKKDDIVDKKDGMKRERVVKPVIHLEEKDANVDSYEDNNLATVDIDSVRKKAYGGLELLEKNATSGALNETNDSKDEEVVEVKEETTEVSYDKPSVEDQLDDSEYEVTNVVDVSEEKDNIEEKFPIKEEVEQKPKALDDMEKTNTLQILDDIEKELNSIKPLSKEEPISKEDEMREHLEKSDTLENDLFNLIDSMYEDGEEEEND